MSKFKGYCAHVAWNGRCSEIWVCVCVMFASASKKGWSRFRHMCIVALDDIADPAANINSPTERATRPGGFLLCHIRTKEAMRAVRLRAWTDPIIPL